VHYISNKMNGLTFLKTDNNVSSGELQNTPIIIPRTEGEGWDTGQRYEVAKLDKALDSKTGVEILNILKRLNAQGRTIILITHDLLIAQQAKRIVRFRDGWLNEVV
jgi:ABC-type hemin transport system ATPase subunit